MASKSEEATMRINELLILERPLIVLDAETTGVDVNVDRIAELGFQKWDASGMLKEWRALINPGIPMPNAAADVHGITDEVLRGCRDCGLPVSAHPARYGTHSGEPCESWTPLMLFSQIASNLSYGFSGCDFAGKNVRFDLRILAAEMRRASVDWSYADARVIDAERLEQIAVPRTLTDLHKKYTGEAHEGAHGALSDVQASLTVIERQLEQHTSLPRDIAALHALQWPGWVDPEGKFRFVNGVACFGNWGKYAGKPMSSTPADYWDFILKTTGPQAFSPDIKALAAAAKLGKFPKEK